MGRRLCAAIGPAVLLPWLAANAAGASVLRVDASDGTCGGALPCFSAIQPAIDAAVPGDRVLVASGTYRETLRISRKNEHPQATESDRIVIEGDSRGSGVVLMSPARGCAGRPAVTFDRSRFVTFRGFTIRDASGWAVLLRGGARANESIHVEGNRIHDGGGSCSSGIAVRRHNRSTLIVNNVIHDLARVGIDVDGRNGRRLAGPHTILSNTIARNGREGITLSGLDPVRIANNLIVHNGLGRRRGARAGIRGRRSASESALLEGNVVCGNAGGEIVGELLDAGDRANRTPGGDEGPGVMASPGCDELAARFEDASGVDGILGTSDDGFVPAEDSPARDAGVELPSRFPEIDPGVLGADLAAASVRPLDGDGDGIPAWDAGAREAPEPRASTPTPAATPTPTPAGSPTPEASPTPVPTPAGTPTPGTGATPTPEPPLDGELLDGALYLGTGGLVVGAQAGSLATPLPIGSQRVAAPPQPLPGGAVPRSLFHRLRSGRDEYGVLGAIFFVGLPVPPGADVQHLALALHRTGADDGPDDWIVVPGLWDATREMLLAPLPRLVDEGDTVVAIEHPSLSSPPNPPASTARSRAAVAAPAAGGSFEVVCLLDDPIDREFCDAGTPAVEQAFQDVFSELISLGYPRPTMMTLSDRIEFDPPSVTASFTYVAVIDPIGRFCGSETSNILGYYQFDAAFLNLCVVPTSLPLLDTYVRTVRHEYFHAVQYSYANVVLDRLEKKIERWILEGTAALVAGSEPGVLGRWKVFEPRRVDRSLRSDEGNDEYASQDFWRYLLEESGSGLERLQTLHAQGVTTEDVASWVGGPEALGNWYWRWAKEQFFAEQSEDPDGNPVPPCEPQAGSSEVVDFPMSGGPKEGTLEPLTSRTFRFHNDLGFDLVRLGFWEHFTRSPAGNPDISFKLYREGETCSLAPEGARLDANFLYDVESGEEMHVIVSNRSTEESRSFSLVYD